MSIETVHSYCLPSRPPKKNVYILPKGSKIKKEWTENIKQNEKETKGILFSINVNNDSKIPSAQFTSCDAVMKSVKQEPKPSPSPTMFNLSNSSQSSHEEECVEMPLTEEIVLPLDIKTEDAQPLKAVINPSRTNGAKPAEKTQKAGPLRHQKGKALSSGEKMIVHNVFSSYLPVASKAQRVSLAAHQTGIGASTVWKIIKEMEQYGKVVSPKTTRPRRNLFEKIDETTKELIRKTVANVVDRTGNPTLTLIKQAFDENDQLPKFGRSTLWRVLQTMGFSFPKKSQKLFAREKKFNGKKGKGLENSF